MLHLARLRGWIVEPLWTPAQISTAAWYDAADASSLSLGVGGQVTEWRDKSGADRHLAPSGALGKPVYDPAGATGGLPAVVWQSPTYNEALRHGAAFTWQYAMSVSRYADGLQATWLSGFQGMFATDSTFGCIGETAGEAGFVGSLTNGLRIDGQVEAGASVDPALPWPTRVLGARITAGPTSDVFVLGNDRNNIGRGWTGPISEVVVLAATPSDATRQQLEGYLAHKWGTAQALPLDHPHKTAPPFA